MHISLEDFELVVAFNTLEIQREPYKERSRSSHPSKTETVQVRHLHAGLYTMIRYQFVYVKKK